MGARARGATTNDHAASREHGAEASRVDRRPARGDAPSFELADERPRAAATRQLQRLADARPQARRQASLLETIASAPSASASTLDAASETHAPVVQRRLRLKAPTKSYRRAGKSASSLLNQAIDRYNELCDSIAPVAERMEQLQAIRAQLAGISDKKHDFRERMTAELDREAASLDRTRREEQEFPQEREAVMSVMDLARRRAQMQQRNPVISRDLERGGPDDPASRLADAVLSAEVLHATNPLKAVGPERSVGDEVADTHEVRNVHQTGHSLVGKASDSPKRKNAEIGSFYPMRHRRASFSRESDENPSATKGLDPDLLPPDRALPKYAAINLARSDFGAIAEEYESQVPLHFAIKDEVLRERATITSGDSLRQWRKFSSGYNALRNRKAITGIDALPRDDAPWETGPIATYDGQNIEQVIHEAGLHRMPEQNSGDYIEVQIHGALRLDHDVKHVRANFAKLFGNPRFESLYRELSRLRISILWYFRDTSTHIAEGNLVTQGEEGSERFAGAWSKANRIWTELNQQLSERFDGHEGAIEGRQKEGWLDEASVGKLKAIWDALK